MRRKIFLAVILGAGLFIQGIPAVLSAKEPKPKKPESYRVDLDNDGKKEITQIEERVKPNGDTVITISRLNKTKVSSVAIAGTLTKIEFIDLNNDGFKHIAVSYRDKDNAVRLVIYGLKNNKLNKIFSAASNYDIETDFNPMLARVKVAQMKAGLKDPSASDVSYWEFWVWGGEKFIRER